MKKLFLALITFCLMLSPAKTGWLPLAAPFRACSDDAASAAFLARTSGLNGLHKDAYCTLIKGLEADGIWTKLDILFVFATQDSTTALLNLLNATYTASTSASPTFTVDRGFSNSSNTGAIGTTFNPQTASSPNFVQNAAHLSVWNLNNAQSGDQSISISTSGDDIFPAFVDGNVYLRVNDNPESGGFANASPLGFYLGNRDSSTTRQGYRNGVSVGAYGSITSVPTPNSALVALSTGTVNNNAVAQISAGGSLNSTDQLNYYNRLRTYMTTVGVP